jgi:thiamine-phosphate pyrophosphorylase
MSAASGVPLTPLPRSGLYAITDTTACARHGIVASVTMAIAGGARMVQYRDKSNDAMRRERESRALLRLCRGNAVPLIINDDAALAAAIGADGVHIGQDDGSVAKARSIVGPHSIVGASCYHHLDLARRAADEGASYVAFGRCFPSRSKPGRPLATPELIATAREQVPLPVVAIGGIEADNGSVLIDAGAHMLACILSVFGHDDVTTAARRLQDLFESVRG